MCGTTRRECGLPPSAALHVAHSDTRRALHGLPKHPSTLFMVPNVRSGGRGRWAGCQSPIGWVGEWGRLGVELGVGRVGGTGRRCRVGVGVLVLVGDLCAFVFLGGGGAGGAGCTTALRLPFYRPPLNPLLTLTSHISYNCLVLNDKCSPFCTTMHCKHQHLGECASCPRGVAVVKCATHMWTIWPEACGS